ncbi:MAG: nucleotidyltransferase family protein [Candidatus Paceibacterota bacterium]
MQAIILAAGEGIRLKPLTDDIPKCLIKVGKKTILEHTISELPQSIKEVIIVVGHLKGKIKKQIGNHFDNRNIRYVEQVERFGTGHALFTAKDAIGNDKFAVLMGDNIYTKRDIESCLSQNLALLAKEVEAPERFGVLNIENGSLIDVKESPKLTAGSLVNCGLYILDKRIFSYPLVAINQKEYGLPQTIAKMSAQHPVKIVKATFWMPINTVQDIKSADKYLKKLYS